MIEKERFRRYKLDEEKDTKSGVISLRLNATERIWLEELKEDLNIKSDSKALKVGAYLGKNVIQQVFGRDLLKYLFKHERQKLTDYKNF